MDLLQWVVQPHLRSGDELRGHLEPVGKTEFLDQPLRTDQVVAKSSAAP